VSRLGLERCVAVLVNRAGAELLRPLSAPTCRATASCLRTPLLQASSHLPHSAPLPPSAPPLQGYGFLSENATFVDICNDHGLEFIGPKSDSIRVMGDKSTARDTMKVREWRYVGGCRDVRGCGFLKGGDGMCGQCSNACRCWFG
jgi:hypothetical protein